MSAVTDFERDGAVCLRGVIGPEALETLRAAVDANLAQPSLRAKIASRPDDPGQFIEDFCNWRSSSGYRRFIRESGLGMIAATLMQSRRARLYHDHMLTKQPGTRQPTPWHQDQPYYNIDGRQNCSFWIPVDPVAESESLRLVAGSHKGPWLMPRSFMDAEAKWFPEGSLQELPDIDGGDYPIRSWALEPGDAVCFHMLTLHSTRGCSTRRRVFSLRFLGDDIVHAPRAWKTSPTFPELDAELPPGAPMEHPLFPLVWPAPAPELLT